MAELQLTPTGRPRSGRKRLYKKKILFPNESASSGPVSAKAWGIEEKKSIIEFILLHGDPQVWPSHSRKSRFWISASEFVKRRSNSSIQRSGKES